MAGVYIYYSYKCVHGVGIWLNWTSGFHISAISNHLMTMSKRVSHFIPDVWNSLWLVFWSSLSCKSCSPLVPLLYKIYYCKLESLLFQQQLSGLSKQFVYTVHACHAHSGAEGQFNNAAWSLPGACSIDEPAQKLVLHACRHEVDAKFLDACTWESQSRLCTTNPQNDTRLNHLSSLELEQSKRQNALLCVLLFCVHVCFVFCKLCAHLPTGQSPITMVDWYIIHSTAHAWFVLVSRGHTPFRKRGKGSGSLVSRLSRREPGDEARGLVQFVSPLCTVQDQSQRSILSHKCCYHNFDRKLNGVNQLGNHKQLLCQSGFSNWRLP